MTILAFIALGAYKKCSGISFSRWKRILAENHENQQNLIAISKQASE